MNTKNAAKTVELTREDAALVEKMKARANKKLVAPVLMGLF